MDVRAHIEVLSSLHSITQLHAGVDQPQHRRLLSHVVARDRQTITFGGQSGRKQPDICAGCHLRTNTRTEVILVYSHIGPIRTYGTPAHTDLQSLQRTSAHDASVQVACWYTDRPTVKNTTAGE